MSTIQCPSSFLIFFLIVATARIHVAFSAIAMECLEMTDPTAVVDEATHEEILRCNFCNTPRFYFLERLRNPGTNSLCYSKYLVKFGDDSVSDRISRTFLDYLQGACVRPLRSFFVCRLSRSSTHSIPSHTHTHTHTHTHISSRPFLGFR